jgi:threonine dehydratase
MLTPQESFPKLAKAIGIPEIILKREDLHPYGSHKGRSIPYMINEYTKQGYSDFVISSSGNAALAAAFAVNKHNKNNPDKKITLQIFVGQNIEKEKLKILENTIADKNITINQVERPKQSAFQLNKEGKIKNLRQSTDDLALYGYKSLADELSEIKNLQAIFIPTSSGTTAQALGNLFSKINLNPQIHIIQTCACPVISSEFDTNYYACDASLAEAIVDNVAHRKEKVVKAIKNSHGFGWIVSDEEIKKAITLVKETTGIDISGNSALSVAGLMKAIKNDRKFDGSVVCLITGK